jgi:hypothetical protein
MASLSKICTAAVLLWVVACAAKEDPTGVIPQGHLDAMDKSKDVENVLRDANKKQLDSIDNSG